MPTAPSLASVNRSWRRAQQVALHLIVSTQARARASNKWPVCSAVGEAKAAIIRSAIRPAEASARRPRRAREGHDGDGDGNLSLGGQIFSPDADQNKQMNSLAASATLLLCHFIPNAQQVSPFSLRGPLSPSFYCAWPARRRQLAAGRLQECRQTRQAVSHGLILRSRSEHLLPIGRRRAARAPGRPGPATC